MGRRAVFGVLVAIAVVAFTWFSSEKQSVPVTGRTQRVAMSDTQQEQLGLQVFDQTLQEQQGAGNVITTGPQYAQVERVAKRIAKVGAVDKPEFDWAVALVHSDEVNAFCLPGGKIVVYTGLLGVAKTDDELATVLGHEVAHAVAEHGAERILREQLTQRAVTAASGAFADDPQRYQQVAGLLGAGAQVGLSLPWGRAQESEADHIGLIYMARAGYDPPAALTFWKRMQRTTEGGAPPEYLSTHPSGTTRIKQIQGWIPEAQRERTQHDEVEGDVAA
ncbi:MAG: Peptidase Ste24p precursor [Thermoleophilia bacterium]|nr:Peptidase Ste24p precursor [Thermoleophilia bacterium]